MAKIQNPQTPLQAIVFHGQHTNVDGYAKNSSMTVILQPSVLAAGDPTDDVEGPDGRLIMTWDKDPAGIRNSTSQQSVIVRREMFMGEQLLILRAQYYWFKGKLNGAYYSGQYYNPKNDLCGSFELTTKCA